MLLVDVLLLDDGMRLRLSIRRPGRPGLYKLCKVQIYS